MLDYLLKRWLLIGWANKFLLCFSLLLNTVSFLRFAYFNTNYSSLFTKTISTAISVIYTLYLLLNYRFNFLIYTFLNILSFIISIFILLIAGLSYFLCIATVLYICKIDIFLLLDILITHKMPIMTFVPIIIHTLFAYIHFVLKDYFVYVKKLEIKG